MGITYGVEVEFLTKGDFKMEGLKRSTDEWGKSLMGSVHGFASGMGSAMDSVMSKMASLGEAGVSAITHGMAAGMALAVVEGIKFNEQIENSIISIAAVANANGIVGSLSEGFWEAGKAVKAMKLDAAKLPGEFRDLQGILGAITPMMAQMGMGLNRGPNGPGIEGVAAQIMTAAAVLLPDRPGADKLAGREWAMMMAGSARGNMPLFQALGLGDAKDFNALNQHDRFAKAYARLSDVSGPDVQARYEKSFIGLRTTATQFLRGGTGTLSEKLMGDTGRNGISGSGIKGMLEKFNEASTNGTFAKMGESIQDHLDKAFQTVNKWKWVFLSFGHNVYDGLHNAFNRISPMVDKMFDRLAQFMIDPNAFNKIVKMGEEFLAIRAGVGALSAGGSLLSSGMPLLSGGVELAEVAAAAGPVAVALAALALTAYAVVDTYLDMNAAFHDSTRLIVHLLKEDGRELGSNMTKLAKDLEPAAAALGVTILAITDVGIQLANLASSVGLLFPAFQSLAGVINGIKWLAGVPAALNDPTDRIEKQNHPYDPALPHLLMDVLTDGSIRLGKPPEPPKTQTTIHKVEIQVNSNQDPQRIAKQTLDIITGFARHPKVASLTGNPVLSR